MKIYEINNQKYRLPNSLNDFQLAMYVHLINWKWENVSKDVGFYKNDYYDLFVSTKHEAQLHPIHPPIEEDLLEHQRRFPFKFHKFLGRNLASSQAACTNLFLPLFKEPDIAARVLSEVKTDIKKIATDFLDNGFKIEFWDEPDSMLKDHNNVSGTDADIAIAYYDHQDNLNLWMIEHKLTEKEFTTCGGYKSKGKKSHHSCESTPAILENPNLCYYHSICNYRYWDITISKTSPFKAHKIGEYGQCPFRGGLNQLWRNQLLASCIEASPKWPYKNVYFSVVYHPGNNSLRPTIKKYKKIIDDSDRFFEFTSDKIIRAAEKINAQSISEWVNWYKDLYYF